MKNVKAHFFQNVPQCAVPENIHTPPTQGIQISWGVGGPMRKSKEMYMYET